MMTRRGMSKQIFKNTARVIVQSKLPEFNNLTGTDQVEVNLGVTWKDFLKGQKIMIDTDKHVIKTKKTKCLVTETVEQLTQYYRRDVVLRIWICNHNPNRYRRTTIPPLLRNRRLNLSDERALLSEDSAGEPEDSQDEEEMDEDDPNGIFCFRRQALPPVLVPQASEPVQNVHRTIPILPGEGLISPSVRRNRGRPRKIPARFVDDPPVMEPPERSSRRKKSTRFNPPAARKSPPQNSLSNGSKSYKSSCKLPNFNSRSALDLKRRNKELLAKLPPHVKKVSVRANRRSAAAASAKSSTGSHRGDQPLFEAATTSRCASTGNTFRIVSNLHSRGNEMSDMEDDTAAGNDSTYGAKSNGAFSPRTESAVRRKRGRPPKRSYFAHKTTISVKFPTTLPNNSVTAPAENEGSSTATSREAVQFQQKPPVIVKNNDIHNETFSPEKFLTAAEVARLNSAVSPPETKFQLPYGMPKLEVQQRDSSESEDSDCDNLNMGLGIGTTIFDMPNVSTNPITDSVAPVAPPIPQSVGPSFNIPDGYMAQDEDDEESLEHNDEKFKQAVASHWKRLNAGEYRLMQNELRNLSRNQHKWYAVLEAMPRTFTTLTTALKIHGT